MTELPLVSVCIQTYQHAAFIRQCLESVLVQETTFPFEIIIGEDDSTDGTREICIEYERRYPERIRLFLRNESDKIHIDGMKTGRFNFISNLRSAKGRFIALLDGDDYWTDSKKLQKQVNFLEKEPACALCFCQHAVQKQGRPRRIFRLLPRKRSYTVEDLARKTIMHMSSVMFRNPGFEAIPSYLLETPFIDLPFFLYLGSRGKIGYLNDCMVVYRMHEHGIWAGISREKRLLQLVRMYSILGPEYAGAVRLELRKKLQKHSQSLAAYYIEKGEFEKAEALKKEVAFETLNHNHG